jgi:opacity protein-like surface antigen
MYKFYVHALALSLAALATLPGVEAEATKGWYAKLEGGLGSADKTKFSNDKEYAWSSQEGYFGIGLGYRMNDFMRANVNVARYNGPKLDKPVAGTDEIKGTSTLLTVDGYANLFRWKGLSPYLTAGAGLSLNSTNKWKVDATDYEDGSSMGFAWNFGGGMQYKFNKEWAVDLGYKYLSLGKFEPKEKTIKSESVTAHAITLGLQYDF